MNDLTLYIMVIAAIGLGVVFITQRFVRKNQNTKEYNYRPKSNLDSKNTSIEERMNFRTKGRQFQEADKSISYREAYNRELKKAGSISNYELNRTFWIALSVLVSLVLLIIIL